jgi:uncharacterized protein (TIGR02996 family)
MTERDALYQAVVESPDEDAPRLVFADWLDDHGEHEQADFIRFQVQMALLPEYDRDHQRGRHHQRTLYFSYSFRHFLPSLPAGMFWPTDAFQRGFGARVAARHVDAFLACAEQLFALAPIRHLELDLRNGVGPEQVARLAASPWLGRLCSLNLNLGRLGAEPMRRLCESPHASGLRHLALPFAGVIAAGVEALVGSSLFPRLLTLDLSWTDYADPVGPPLAAALERLTTPCRLTKLNLRGTRFGPADAERLARSAVVQSLTDLEVSECSYDRMLREPGFRALAHSPHLAGLHILRLWKTDPQLNGMRALTESKTLTNLHFLDLRWNRLGPRAARLLAESPSLAGVEVLLLSNNELGDKGIQALMDSPHLTRLSVLELRGTKMTNQGARAILEARNLNSPVRIELENHKLGESIRKALAERFGAEVVQ